MDGWMDQYNQPKKHQGNSIFMTHKRVSLSLRRAGSDVDDHMLGLTSNMAGIRAILCERPLLPWRRVYVTAPSMAVARNSRIRAEEKGIQERPRAETREENINAKAGAVISRSPPSRLRRCRNSIL